MPLDFGVWGWVRRKVYSSRPTDLQDLVNRISNAFTEITAEMVGNIIDDFHIRLMACRDVEGRQFEQLLH